MPYKRLFILIEGNDDERLFQRIIKNGLQEKYDDIKLWKYSEEPYKRRKDFLRSINSMGADYIYIADYDENTRCITAKKQGVKNKIENINEDRIMVVINEIESWFLAGLNNNWCRRFKIPSYTNTDNITKEQFNSLIAKKFDSRIVSMREILKCFSIETAIQKNESFKYFIEKYDC